MVSPHTDFTGELSADNGVGCLRLQQQWLVKGDVEGHDRPIGLKGGAGRKTVSDAYFE